MDSEDRRLLATIIMTLSDPKGNWPFAWKQLCAMADLDPDAYQPHFAPNPILDQPTKPLSTDNKADT